MPLLKPATNEQAYLKCGILGFAASGKTRTATEIAIGLHKYIKSDKPVSFLDTETGSDFVLPIFKQAEIPLLVAKTRSFLDLRELCQEIEKQSSIVILDSVTHYWVDLRDSFMRKKKIERLQIHHIDALKREWKPFSEWVVNSKLHIIVCGRAGYEFDYKEDNEGFQTLQKTGTKMKVENEFGYEPSLLLEMVRERTNEGRPGQGWTNRCWVIKDRFDKINGKYFDKPTFKNILPHVSLLNIGGVHHGVDSDRSSDDLFDSGGSRSEEYRRRKIYLEEIENEMVLRWPSSSKDDRQAKVEVLQRLFNSSSWTAISELTADVLQQKLMEIREIPKGKNNE